MHDGSGLPPLHLQLAGPAARPAGHPGRASGGAGELQVQRRQAGAVVHQPASSSGRTRIESLPISGTSAACVSGPPATSLMWVTSAGS